MGIKYAIFSIIAWRVNYLFVLAHLIRNFAA